MSYFYFSVFPHLRKHAKTRLENSQLMSKRTSSTHKTHKSVFPRFLFLSLNILAPNVSAHNNISCSAPPLPPFCSQRKPWLREPVVSEWSSMDCHASCFSLDSSIPFLFIISVSFSFFVFSFLFFFFLCAWCSRKVRSQIWGSIS